METISRWWIGTDMNLTVFDNDFNELLIIKKNMYGKQNLITLTYYFSLNYQRELYKMELYKQYLSTFRTE